MSDSTLTPDRTPTDDDLRRELLQLVRDGEAALPGAPEAPPTRSARSRERVQRWCAERVALDDGRRVSPALVRVLLADIVRHLELELGGDPATGARLNATRAALECELLDD